jgi:hypothetical protein
VNIHLCGVPTVTFVHLSKRFATMNCLDQM